MQNILEADPRFQVKVSRKSPTQLLGTNNSSSLVERVNLANKWDADYFISIHTNSSTNKLAKGTEVYVYKPKTKAFELASDVLDSIVDHLNTLNRGVRVNSSLYVLRKTKMPAILIELGYITNKQDAYLLKNKQYDFAYSIYLGILDYLDLDLLKK